MRQLEEAFGARGLAVVGVHSPKFPAERETAHLAAALARLGVRHPVANDRDLRVWSAYGVRAWPTLVLVGPDGRELGRHEGEFPYAAMAQVVAAALRDFSRRGLLTAAPWPLSPPEPLPGDLAFPGKVLAAPEGVYAADTAHGRVLRWDDRGNPTGTWSGMVAPQGLAVLGDALYVADPPAGVIWRAPRAGGAVHPLQEGLRSPWDVAVAEGLLYAAMAGAHQIWRGPPEGPLIPWVGTGAEGLRDGAGAQAWLAQPSGLCVAPGALFVADSEASAVRRIALPEGEVTTVVGQGLFVFGDRDGVGEAVRLQHPLGVTWDPERDRVYVADSYNGKVRVLRPKTREVTTLATGLAEPGGLAWDPDRGCLWVADTNRHRILRLTREGAMAPFP